MKPPAFTLVRSDLVDESARAVRVAAELGMSGGRGWGSCWRTPVFAAISLGLALLSAAMIASVFVYMKPFIRNAGNEELHPLISFGGMTGICAFALLIYTLTTARRLDDADLSEAQMCHDLGRELNLAPAGHEILYKTLMDRCLPVLHTALQTSADRVLLFGKVNGEEVALIHCHQNLALEERYPVADTPAHWRDGVSIPDVGPRESTMDMNPYASPQVDSVMQTPVNHGSWRISPMKSRDALVLVATRPGPPVVDFNLVPENDPGAELFAVDYHRYGRLEQTNYQLPRLPSYRFFTPDPVAIGSRLPWEFYRLVMEAPVIVQVFSGRIAIVLPFRDNSDTPFWAGDASSFKATRASIQRGLAIIQCVRESMRG